MLNLNFVFQCAHEIPVFTTLLVSPFYASDRWLPSTNKTSELKSVEAVVSSILGIWGGGLSMTILATKGDKKVALLLAQGLTKNKLHIQNEPDTHMCGTVSGCPIPQVLKSQQYF